MENEGRSARASVSCLGKARDTGQLCPNEVRTEFGGRVLSRPVEPSFQSLLGGAVETGHMMRFLGWYIAALLAAYSLSASWSLGLASSRVSVVEHEAARLSAELEAVQSAPTASDRNTYCDYMPEVCVPKP